MIEWNQTIDKDFSAESVFQIPPVRAVNVSESFVLNEKALLGPYTAKELNIYGYEVYMFIK